MRTVLAALLLLTPAARAADSGSNKPNVIGPSAKSGGSKGGSGDAGGAYPAGVPRSTNWIPFERLKDIPEAVGGHRIMRVPGAGVGWAVGFLTNAGFPENEMRNGVFATAPTPGAGTHAACVKHMWISGKVGGSPLRGCYTTSHGASPTSLTWRVLGAGMPKPKSGEACVLQPGRRYYAHYTATGWDRSDADRPDDCDALLNGSLSYVPD